MPNNSELGYGNGIAAGANAFVENFMRAKDFKHQEKLQQNAFVVQLLTDQLRDENIPYYKRAQILDQIPPLLGIKKMDRRLSEMMGLDKFNEEQVQDPNAPAISSQQGTNPTSVTDTNVTNPQMASTINLKGTQATQEVPAGTTSQGNLTPAIIKSQLRERQMQVDTAMDIAKQRASYEAQAEILNKGGYTQKVAQGYQGKDYVITMSNGQDTKNIVLKDYTPEPVRVAEIRYKGTGQSGNLGTLMKANGIIADYEANPTPEMEPQYKAAKAIVDNFNLTGVLKKEQIKSLELGNSGLKPPTIASTKSDEDRDRTARIQVQKDIDDAEGVVKGIESKLATYDKGGTNDKSAAATESSIAEDRRRKLLDDVGANDPEYKNAAKDAKEKLTRYQRLEKEYTDLQQQKTLANTKWEKAKQRMGLVGSNSNPDTTTSMQNLSPISQAYIKEVFHGDVAKAQRVYFKKYGKYLQ